MHDLNEGQKIAYDIARRSMMCSTSLSGGKGTGALDRQRGLAPDFLLEKLTFVQSTKIRIEHGIDAKNFSTSRSGKEANAAAMLRRSRITARVGARKPGLDSGAKNAPKSKLQADLLPVVATPTRRLQTRRTKNHGPQGGQ